MPRLKFIGLGFAAQPDASGFGCPTMVGPTQAGSTKVGFCFH
jgi:hypothetical protein